MALAGKILYTEFEQNWMVEVGPRYRRLTERERLENPLPQQIHPDNVRQLLDTLRQQEKRWFRWLRLPCQKPLPLKWERIYVEQLHQADAHLEMNYIRTVRATFFRQRIRMWTRRSLLLFALYIVANVIVPEPTEWLELIQVPERIGEELLQRIVAQQNAILAAFHRFFVSYQLWWIALGAIYIFSFFFRAPVFPSGEHRRITARIHYLSRDGIMLRTGQLVQWSGLEIVFDKEELFEIRLRNPKNYRVMLHINCTLDQYIPLYLFVKKCVSKS